MDKTTSSEFRRRYATLTKPTIVTVLGRPIGTWTPTQGGPWIEHQQVASGVRYNRSTGELRAMTPDEHKAMDEWADSSEARLRFNSRPFTPAPKKGK